MNLRLLLVTFVAFMLAFAPLAQAVAAPRDPEPEEYAKARGRKPRGERKAESPRGNGKQDRRQDKKKKDDKKKPGKDVGLPFAEMKGTLPQPVTGNDFEVVRSFGEQRWPGQRKVKLDNPGIDAVAGKNAQARAVAAGKVSAVYFIPGYRYVVIISHDGGYYTVYAHLREPDVKKGDKVKVGKKLGKLTEYPQNPRKGILHFEVWKRRTKLNPKEWLDL